MLAVVKMPHTKKTFEVKGNIPDRLLKYLRKEYGNELIVTDDEKSYVDITKTDWYKKQKSRRTPGQAVKVYRLRDNLTQPDLGKKLGGLSAQYVSDIENNRRGVSKGIAKKLSHLFGTTVDKFL